MCRSSFTFSAQPFTADAVSASRRYLPTPHRLVSFSRPAGFMPAGRFLTVHAITSLGAHLVSCQLVAKWLVFATSHHDRENRRYS